jgi:hypothetical protein
MGHELRLFALDVHRLKSVEYKGGCFAGAHQIGYNDEPVN